jgi:hypothetical protein
MEERLARAAVIVWGVLSICEKLEDWDFNSFFVNGLSGDPLIRYSGIVILEIGAKKDLFGILGTPNRSLVLSRCIASSAFLIG